MAKQVERNRAVSKNKASALSAKGQAARATGPQRAVSATKPRAPAKAAVAANSAANEAQAPDNGTPEAVFRSQLQPAARQVLELYEQRAAELRFPGVSCESLVEHAERLEQFAQKVAEAEERLKAAQTARAAAETEFVDATKRAFAYAQVYAQEHPQLQQELQAFAYASEKPRRKPREARTAEAQPREDSASGSSKSRLPKVERVVDAVDASL